MKPNPGLLLRFKTARYQLDRRLHRRYDSPDSSGIRAVHPGFRIISVLCPASPPEPTVYFNVVVLNREEAVRNVAASTVHANVAARTRAWGESGAWAAAEVHDESWQFWWRHFCDEAWAGDALA